MYVKRYPMSLNNSKSKPRRDAAADGLGRQRTDNNNRWKIASAGGDVEKWNPHPLLVRMYSGVATVENSYIIPHHVKQDNQMTQKFHS